MTFSLTENQIKKLDAWLVEQRIVAIEAQKRDPELADNPFAASCWESGYPYGGAIGGGITYSFTPNSIGEVVIVKYDFTGQEIDLSEYDSW